MGSGVGDRTETGPTLEDAASTLSPSGTRWQCGVSVLLRGYGPRKSSDSGQRSNQEHVLKYCHLKDCLRYLYLTLAYLFYTSMRHAVPATPQHLFDACRIFCNFFSNNKVLFLRERKLLFEPLTTSPQVVWLLFLWKGKGSDDFSSVFACVSSRLKRIINLPKGETWGDSNSVRLFCSNYDFFFFSF